MEKRTLTCINCPLGCQIEVILDGGTVQSITGNTCKRGAEYAAKGSHAPDTHRHNLCRRDWQQNRRAHRQLQDRVRYSEGEDLCRHRRARGLTFPAPVRIGDVLLPDAAGTGVPIIATKHVDYNPPPRTCKRGAGF